MSAVAGGTTIRLREVIQSIAVGAKDNGVGKASGQNREGHALEESMELIEKIQNININLVILIVTGVCLIRNIKQNKG